MLCYAVCCAVLWCAVMCCDVLCCAVLCCAVLQTHYPPLSTVPAQPDESLPTHPTSKTDPISSGEVAWARHQDSVPTCLPSHMNLPIGLSQRDGVGWGGVGGGGGHVPSLKGLQALVGFQTLGSRPQPTSTPQGCGDNGTSLILGGTRGGGGGAKSDRGGGVERVLGLGGGVGGDGP